MSINILDKSKQHYKPVMALILYSSDDEYYVESRDIDKTGKMLAGVPLSKECISDIAGSFSVEQSSTPFGNIPSNMLYFDNRKGHEKYIWYNPPQKRMMFFSKNLKIKDGEYCTPGIIYVVKGDHLDVYSFKGKKPNAKHKLYQAPFFNVSTASVCLGNANIKLPDDMTFYKFIEYWEKKFWLTEFSHLGGSKNPTKNNLVTITKNSTEGFDYKELIQMPITLNYLLK